MSHDPFFFCWFPGAYPPLGVQSAPPSENAFDYKNIGPNHCPCQNSASQLNQCGHASSIKQLPKIAILRSLSAAGGQIRGQMKIELAYLNRIFQELSFDKFDTKSFLFYSDELW